MGLTVSSYSTYANYRPNEQVIRLFPHASFASNITTGLAQNDPNPLALEELSAFMKGFFFPKICNEAYTSLAVGLSLLAAIALVGIGVSIHRFRQGKFWLFRCERRAKGKYLVPNGLNILLVCEIFFATNWTCYVIAVFLVSRSNVTWFQSTNEAHCLSVWYSLYLGTFAAAMGSFFSVPGAFDARKEDAPSFFHRTLRRPQVINFIYFFMPIFCACMQIPTSILAQKAQTRQYRHYRDFADRIATTLESDNLTTPVAQSYLQEASDMWSESAAHLWTIVSLYLWTGFYIVLLCFYLTAGAYMLAVVKKQVNNSKVAAQRQENFQRKLVVNSEANRPVLLHTLGSRSSSAVRSLISQLDRNRRKESSESDSLATGASSSPSKMSSIVQLVKKSYQGGDLEAVAAAPIDNTTTAKAEQEANSHAFRSPQTLSANTDLVSAELVARWKYLRRCFQSLLIMYMGVAATGVVAIFTTALTAASITGSWLKGPQPAADHLSTFLLFVTWSRVIMSLITSTAVCFRFFDHPESPRSSPDISDRVQKSTSGADSQVAFARMPSRTDHGTAASEGLTEASPPRDTAIQSSPLRCPLPSVPEAVAALHGNPSSSESGGSLSISQGGRALELDLQKERESDGLGTPTSMSAASQEANGAKGAEVSGKSSPSLLFSALHPPSQPSSMVLTSITGAQEGPEKPESISAGVGESQPSPNDSRWITREVSFSPPIQDHGLRRPSSSGPAPDRALPTPVQRSKRRPGSTGSTISSGFLAQRRSSTSADMFPPSTSNRPYSAGSSSPRSLRGGSPASSIPPAFGNDRGSFRSSLPEYHSEVTASTLSNFSRNNFERPVFDEVGGLRPAPRRRTHFATASGSDNERTNSLTLPSQSRKVAPRFSSIGTTNLPSPLSSSHVNVEDGPMPTFASSDTELTPQATPTFALSDTEVTPQATPRPVSSTGVLVEAPTAADREAVTEEDSQSAPSEIPPESPVDCNLFGSEEDSPEEITLSREGFPDLS